MEDLGTLVLQQSQDKRIAKKRECKWCKKATLKCIGRQRKNGQAHFDDWKDRDLHKKCLPAYSRFVQLQKQYLKPVDWNWIF